MFQDNEWICAQNDDGKFISSYALNSNNYGEDFAESILPWLAATFRENRQDWSTMNTVRSTIPNRMKYFDQKIRSKVQFPAQPKLNSIGRL